MSVGPGHAAGFADANSIHHFKRTSSPTKADLGAAINVFHAANVFFNDLGGNTKHHAEQTLGHDRELLFRVRGVFRDIPLCVGFNERPQVRSARVPRRVELFGKVVGGVKGDGRTGEVHQAKRPEADTERFAGDGVDLCCIGSAFFEQQAGLVQPGNKESVDDEPGPVSANDDHLAEHFAVLNDLVDGFLARSLGGNDLNQPVLGRVIEEMQSDEPIGTTGGLCQCIHRKRGRVGCQNGAFAARCVKRIEHSGFDVKVLKHGFNDEVGVLGGVLNAHDAGDSSLDGVHLCG